MSCARKDNSSPEIRHTMNQVPLWVTLIGFAAPLLGIAGSAIAYVIKLYMDAGARRRAQFFELMQFIDSNNHPIATKCAAVYQLRDYKEHAGFVVRFCENQRNNIQGSAAAILIAELDETRAAMQKLLR